MPIPPATKTSGCDASWGRTNFPFGGSTSTSAPTGSSTSERLKALSRMRVQSPITPRSVGDVAAWALLVLVGWVEELDPEVLAGLVVELFAEQIEDHEERALGDLPLL